MVFLGRSFSSFSATSIYLREYRNLVELEAGVAMHDYNHMYGASPLKLQLLWYRATDKWLTNVVAGRQVCDVAA